ncbi:MAG: porin family protein [Bacteroidota bacterium]
MKKLTIFFLFFFSILQAQNEKNNLDQKYLDDQIYITAVYQKLFNLPNEISETGFSYGIGFGVIKDIPMNSKRNVGFGIGLGYAFNVHYFNVKEFGLPIQDSNETKSNKIALHMLDLPIEFRFRTSTPQKYKFWRFYPGFKFSYAFAQDTKLKQSENFEVDKVIEINDFQYGITLSAGYNKWNLHVYYGLSELFNEAKNNDFQITPHEFKIGLIFYIL